MKAVRFIANAIPFVLFCAGAYLTIRYNSAWWFLIGFLAAWLSHLVLRQLLKSSPDMDA
jgi:hypothetical protein